MARSKKSADQKTIFSMHKENGHSTTVKLGMDGCQNNIERTRQERSGDYHGVAATRRCRKRLRLPSVTIASGFRAGARELQNGHATTCCLS